MSSNNWWANKLGGSTPAPQQPRPQQFVAPIQPTSPQQPSTLTNRELASQQASKCPNCSSGNYGRPAPEAKARCYDCGYPIVQSASGGGAIRTSGNAGGPVERTAQLPSSGFNPDKFIGPNGEIPS